MAVATKHEAQHETDEAVAPKWHAKAAAIQKFGSVIEDMPHYLDAKVRGKMCEMLNVLLADSIALRDLYKKHHWQVSGVTFYQLHLLFDKHYEEQAELADKIAERIQLLGGVSVAMGGDVAKLTQIPAPPIDKEEVPVQISRLLEAHKIVMEQCAKIADAADKAGDDGTNDLAVSDILRPNELQSWFVGQHLVEERLILDK
jgi:starvation-inducible DNA-binding protein